MADLRRSFVISGLERYATLVLNLSMTAILARLLTPEEMGVFLVGAALVMLTETFRDFGANMYIVQARELTREGTRTAATVMIGISACLALGLFTAAGLVAQLYGEPRLTPVLHIAALAVVLTPLVSPVTALLRRELAFGTLAIVNLSYWTTNFAVAVSLAFLGFGFLSPAWGSLAATVVSVSLGLALRGRPWMLKPSLVAWRDVVTFGGYSTASNLLQNLYAMLPQLLLGRVLGFDAVGLYARAALLCQLPDRAVVSAFMPVVLPALAAHARDDKELAPAYLHGLTLLSAVHWPALICLAILADPIVALVLGSQWSEAAGLLRLMAIAWLARFADGLAYPILLAAGRIRETFMITVITIPVAAAVFALATPFGLYAAAASLLVTAPFQAIVGLRRVRRVVPFGWDAFERALRPSGVATLGAAIVPLGCLAAAGFSPSAIGILGLLPAVVGAGIGWLAGLWISNHPLLDELVRGGRATWRLALSSLRAPVGSPGR